MGKLLDGNIIDEANIIYSKMTGENKEYFEEINNKFNVNYLNLNELKNEESYDIIHLCRSGVWLDDKFKI